MKLSGCRTHNDDDCKNSDNKIHHVRRCACNKLCTVCAKKTCADDNRTYAYPVVQAELTVEQVADRAEGSAESGQHNDDEGEVKKIYDPIDSPDLLGPVCIVVSLVDS